MDKVIAVMYLIVIFALIVCSIMCTFSILHRRKIEKMTMYQLHTGSVIDMSIPELLSIVINESFDDYKIKELLPLNEDYINSEREAEIRRGLTSLVTSRISEAILDKLSLFYNIENIAEILADKIYITVMNYVLEHNTNLVQE